eukprot:763318-Hanusia_phi.AAC.2
MEGGGAEEVGVGRSGVKWRRNGVRRRLTPDFDREKSVTNAARSILKLFREGPLRYGEVAKKTRIDGIEVLEGEEEEKEEEEEGNVHQGDGSRREREGKKLNQVKDLEMSSQISEYEEENDRGGDEARTKRKMEDFPDPVCSPSFSST